MAAAYGICRNFESVKFTHELQKKIVIIKNIYYSRNYLLKKIIEIIHIFFILRHSLTESRKKNNFHFVCNSNTLRLRIVENVIS